MEDNLRVLRVMRKDDMPLAQEKLCQRTMIVAGEFESNFVAFYKTAKYLGDSGEVGRVLA